MYDFTQKWTARRLHMLALAAIVVFFAYHALGHAVPVGLAGPQCDNLTQALPKLTFYANELRAGRWPSWDPYAGTGTADYPIRSYLIYPTTLLTAYLLPPWLALLADYLLAFVMAYLFAYALLRRANAPPVAAWAGALAIVFGGLNLRYIFYPYFSQTAAWIPLVFIAVEGLFATQARKTMMVVLGALAVGAMVLAGMLQYLVYTLLFSGLYALLLVVSPVEKGYATASRAIGRLLLALAFVILGFMLGSARLFPLLAKWGSMRGGYDDWAAFSALLLSPKELLAAFAPGAFGNYGLKMHAATVTYGAIAWALAVAVILFGRKKRTDWFWLAVLIVGLAASIRSPLTHLLFAVPGFGGFEPARIWSVAGLALLWLAVRGLAQIHQGSKILLYATAAATGLFALSLFGFLAIEHAGISVRHLLPLLFALGGVIAAVWISRRRGPMAAAAVLALTLALEVFGRAAISAERIDTRTLYRETPITAAIKQSPHEKRVLRVGDRWGWLRDGRLYTMEALKLDAIEDLHAYSSMIDPSLRAAIDSLRESTDYGLNPFDASATIQPFRKAEPLLDGRVDLLGARFVLSQRPLDGPSLIRRAEHAGLFLYENINAFPRAFVADGARFSAERASDLKADVDLRRTVLLTQADPPEPFIPLAGDAPATKVELREWRSTWQEYRVESSTSGWLVVTELFDSEWSATVNDQAATILPADGAFRAVAIPAGKSQVVFSYHPQQLWHGMKRSALALGVLLSLLLWAAIRGRVRSSQMSEEPTPR